MPWVPRGLREGIVTSRYPRRAERYDAAFRAAVVVDAARLLDTGVPETGRQVTAAAAACPTGAIALRDGQPSLDRGRCILCGRCVELCPSVFHFDAGFETAAPRRTSLVVPELPDDDAAIEGVRAEIGRRMKTLRRSVHVRHVDAGSDGSEEWEVGALTNPLYDVQRLGIYFTASPRHADLLLATGVGAAGMIGPLLETYEVMPEPKLVVAAGVDAVSGGLVGQGYASSGGLADVLPVDVFVPGAPPSPFSLLYGILLAIGKLPARRAVEGGGR